MHTVAIKSDGALWAWGSNSNNQLGVGSPNKKAPALVSADSDWAEVAAGEGHTLAVKTDVTLWAWGANSIGQLGDGTNKPEEAAHLLIDTLLQKDIISV